MKIEIEIKDLKSTLDGLNNALHAYNDLIFAITIGCEIPKKYDGLKKYNEDELTHRFNCTKELYEQLVVYEAKENKNDT